MPRKLHRRKPAGFPLPLAPVCGYTYGRAVVVVEGAAVDFVRRTTTMIIIGIILSLVGLAYLCWLLFALAVYALPVVAGLTAGLAAYHSGSGPIGAIIVGAIASAITLLLGQIAVTTLRSPVIRIAVVLLFAMPAAMAGYHAALGLAHIAIPGEGWRDAVAVAGAIIVAATAWVRMVLFAPPDAGRGIAAGLTSPRPPTSQTRAGCTRHQSCREGLSDGSFRSRRMISPRCR